MSLDELIFSWFWRRRKERRAVLAMPSLKLDSIQDRLQIVASAVGGAGTRLREAEREGGISGRIISLPTVWVLQGSTEETFMRYLVRTALSAKVIALKILPKRGHWTPEEQAIGTAIAMGVARRHLLEELPGAEPVIRAELASWCTAVADRPRTPLESVLIELMHARGEDAKSAGEVPPYTASRLDQEVRRLARIVGSHLLPPPVLLWGWCSPGGEDVGTTDGGTAEVGRPADGKELALRPRDRVRTKNLQHAPEDENPLLHALEKIKTLEEHRGGRKDADGRDELEDHAQALEELDLRDVVRSNENAHSLLRSNAMLESTVGPLLSHPPSDGIPYDEWNFRTQSLRPAWCHLFERSPPRSHVADAHRCPHADALQLEKQVCDVRRTLLNLQASRRPKPRQPDGAEVDDDAMVDLHASRVAGTSPPQQLYIAARRHAPDLSVLLLLDQSLSSDGWIAGTRILDAEVEAAWVLGEAMTDFVHEFSIAAFSSQTRQQCDYTLVKGFSERWSEARTQLLQIKPSGYTRIGPALRHAHRQLLETQARRRLLLLITDGKPNDFDQYEGRYGVQDVRHAVRHARADGIHVHALALDTAARWSLAEMFSKDGYSLLHSPQALGIAMGDVVKRMSR